MKLGNKTVRQMCKENGIPIVGRLHLVPLDEIDRKHDVVRKYYDDSDNFEFCVYSSGNVTCSYEENGHDVLFG